MLSQPANGHYVLVGDDPDERVAVRDDSFGAPDGEWHILDGRQRHPQSWGLLTGPDPSGIPPTVVPLYLEHQAVFDLILPFLALQYRTMQHEARAATSESGAKQLAQAALGVRTVTERLAARYNLPCPVWDEEPRPPAPPTPVEPILAVPVEQEEPVPADGLARRMLRTVWPSNRKSAARAGRHRQPNVNTGGWPVRRSPGIDDTDQLPKVEAT